MIRAIELGLRWVYAHTSLSSLEASLLVPEPFSVSPRKTPDDNTLHRLIRRIDISILQELLTFIYKLAKRLLKSESGPTLDVSIYSVDATTLTVIGPWYPKNSTAFEFHLKVDLDLQVPIEVEFEHSLDDASIPHNGSSFALGFGDSAYFNKNTVSEWLQEQILPIIKPKNTNYVDSKLLALKWLFERYLKVLYRIRGLVEAVISRVAPHSNKAQSQTKRSFRIEILLRCVKESIILLGCIIDRCVRERFGLTLSGLVDVARLESQVGDPWSTLFNMLWSVADLEAVFSQ